MAKVIGKDDQHVHKVTCSKCASMVEYVLNEVQERHGTDYGGGPDGCKWIVCPGCDKDIILESW
jgi:hypothetical protein